MSCSCEQQSLQLVSNEWCTVPPQLCLQAPQRYAGHCFQLTGTATLADGSLVPVAATVLLSRASQFCIDLPELTASVTLNLTQGDCQLCGTFSNVPTGRPLLCDDQLLICGASGPLLKTIQPDESEISCTLDAFVVCDPINQLLSKPLCHTTVPNSGSVLGCLGGQLYSKPVNLPSFTCPPLDPDPLECAQGLLACAGTSTIEVFQTVLTSVPESANFVICDALNEVHQGEPRGTTGIPWETSRMLVFDTVNQLGIAPNFDDPRISPHPFNCDTSRLLVCNTQENALLSRDLVTLGQSYQFGQPLLRVRFQPDALQGIPLEFAPYAQPSNSFGGFLASSVGTVTSVAASSFILYTDAAPQFNSGNWVNDTYTADQSGVYELQFSTQWLMDPVVIGFLYEVGAPNGEMARVLPNWLSEVLVNGSPLPQATQEGRLFISNWGNLLIDLPAQQQSLSFVWAGNLNAGDTLQLRVNNLVPFLPITLTTRRLFIGRLAFPFSLG